MKHDFIFKFGRTVITLPIKPSRFEIIEGIKIQTINISEVGDVALGGKPELVKFSIACIFPKVDYYFSKKEMEPGEYFNMIKKLSHKRQQGRFIVTNTPINLPVIIKSISYAEQDFSGDVYSTIEMVEYRELETTRTVSTGNKKIRTKVSGANNIERTHKIVYGDRLCLLCRKFYGDESSKVYNAVARYNGLPNPHLIPIGTPVKFPPKDKLGI